jgi:hypothetical protein
MMNRRFNLLDFTYFIVCIRLNMFKFIIDSFNKNFSRVTVNFNYFACFILSNPEITFTLSPSLICNFCRFIIYKTSGANETILEKFLSRISRATGPKTRVPRGLLSRLTITAALSSKRIYIPS